MGEPISPADPRYAEALEFLYGEADLLDSGRFVEWLDLLTPDITYRIPARQDRGPSEAPERSGESQIFMDDRASLEVRVRRLGTSSAWAESPPSRTRHFVSNVRVRTAERPEELEVRSSVLVYRSRSNRPQFDLFSGTRLDVLRHSEGAWRLAQRTVWLDQTVVAARNISVFI